MRFFKILVLVSLLILTPFSSRVLAENTFSFSTEPQNVALNELSGPITVHSETSVSETTYITLTSTSGTGQFFSSKTSPEPIALGSYIYISTNNSNRTIYYKDTGAGDFVITANIFNKEKTSQIGTVSQHIFVGTQSSNTDLTSTTTTATTTNETDNTSTTQSSSNTSAHSSPAPLSNIENKIEFEISAGRDRLTTVGSSLVFKVVPTKLQNMSDAGIVYYWSFGDGTSARGNNVNHAYKFAGDYSVVVNASYSDKQAVSRMQVRVISPKILITKVSGGVEVYNNSGAEINLEGWSLISVKKTFIFPADTLIPNSKKIIFADDVTGMTEESISLLNPLGKEFAQIKVSNTNLVVEPKAGVSTLGLNEIQDKIEEVKKEVALISPKVEENKNKQSFAIVQSKPKPELKLESIPDNNFQAEDLAQVFEAEKQTGLVTRIFRLPISGFNFVKRLFVEE
jgi:hypothetical protein